jgi:glycosyltransferase involved in cell wall biosynthesis
VAAFGNAHEREAFRAAEGVQSKDRVFLVSGKLEPRKRPADAIEALARTEAKNTHVWFLGSGLLSDSLKARVSELGLDGRVRFWGFQNQTQMPRVLQAADVCLHPSQLDPWPYSVLECALSGQALLLSDRTGSYPDLVTSMGGGETFACGDINDMALKMSRFTDDEAMLQNHKANLSCKLGSYTEAAFSDIFESAVRSLMFSSSAGR